MTDYPKALAAALDAQKPSGFAYRYRDALAGGTVIRFNSGHEVNGSRPIEAVPYWLGAPPATVALTVLQDLSERFSAMHANGDVWITSVAAAKMAQTAATQAQQPAAAVPDGGFAIVLADALREVIRISDRSHPAWDAVKAAMLAAAPAAPAAATQNPGERP